MSDRQFAASQWPPDWNVGYDSGNGVTEPWTLNVCATLIVAINAKDVIEIGAAVGVSSALFCATLHLMGGGSYLGLEPDGDRRTQATARLQAVPNVVKWQIRPEKAMDLLPSLSAHSYDFAWVDGDHSKREVEHELVELKRILRPRGLICGHDVYGGYHLAEAWKAIGGFALWFPPQAHGSGGIGIYQVPG